MNGWVGHVGWHTADGLPRGGHPSTARHAQARESSTVLDDVLTTVYWLHRTEWESPRVHAGSWYLRKIIIHYWYTRCDPRTQASTTAQWPTSTAKLRATLDSTSSVWIADQTYHSSVFSLYFSICLCFLHLQLHWLPIRQRIEFKLCLFCHLIVHQTTWVNSSHLLLTLRFVQPIMVTSSCLEQGSHLFEEPSQWWSTLVESTAHWS